MIELQLGYYIGPIPLTAALIGTTGDE